MKVIFDVDGTLMNVEHRRHFVEDNNDWASFEAETVNDTRNEHIFEIAENMHDAGHSIVIVSARKERSRYYEAVRDYFNLIHPTEKDIKDNPSCTKIWQRNSL